jgi:signal transduction histidine kinase
MVKIDPAQIQQVLSNLIVNAIHALPEGGTVTVRYGMKQAQPPADHGGSEEDYAFVEVTDDGIGIPEENLARIFVPFFSTKGVGEGTGLGLSIAHGIITDHGGWIAVRSTVGQGSTFSVYLPVEAEE